MDDHAHLLSAGQLVQLQTSFDALQHKFVALMREKADLLDKIQEHEVVILKLASETETIGVCVGMGMGGLGAGENGTWNGKCTMEVN